MIAAVQTDPRSPFRLAENPCCHHGPCSGVGLERVFGGVMADTIFINYRREDSAANAGRLHDRLAQVFGRKRIFMDDQIPAGIDFAAHLNSQIAACKRPSGRYWPSLGGREGRSGTAPPASA
jgi:hypothetical protein